MRRRRSLLIGNVFARVGVVVALVLAVTGLAVATSGRADGPRDEPAPADQPTQHVEVIDLTKEPAPTTSKRAKRPAEEVSRDQMASVEQQIRSRSSRTEAAPDDGVSPGAPSDAQIRRELRQLRRAQSGTPSQPIGRGSGGLVQPTSGQFTSPFGQRWGRLHAGIDLAAPTGTPIRAAASGRVILADATGGYGNYTCIDHGHSVSTCYAHQSRFGTSRGATVAQGEVIGYVGNTGHSFGAHLHFEVRINGRPVDPMDYL
jgi:murein DD-endopeptidase MepM/ murein hydrolase activator NlpD